MRKKIAIIGGKGNMGSRYKAILKYLGHDVVILDQEDWRLIDQHTDIHGVIIASPTDNHYENLRYLKDSRLPILCEKPITKCRPQLEEILKWKQNLQMVNQYEYLIDDESQGVTKYDYWNTGRDGLQWDCINIIGLSNQKPKVKKSLPFWSCTINGQVLKIQEMDGAYVEMVDRWIKHPNPDPFYIMEAHKRVWDGWYE